MKSLKEEDRQKFLSDSVEAIRQEGMQIGMQIGMQKGMQKGRQEGEIKASETIASNLLKGGFKIDQIMQLTGLSKQRIEELAVAIH